MSEPGSSPVPTASADISGTPGGMVSEVSPDAGALARFGADLAPLLAPDASLLVAVSGGPDSMALLLLAHAALGARCWAATVDHGLRDASAAEARWVADQCAARGIRHVIMSGALPGRVGPTANLSARARALRYRLLEQARGAAGATAIATAHHADDQLETVIMRLNRGAGVRGLAAVRARSGRVIRPLLGWRRAELAAIVAAAGIEPVADPSNVDDRFDRARLRTSLADAAWLDPLGAAASAAALADADAALDWTACSLAERCCTFGEGEARCEPPAGLPFELQRRLAARCLAHVDPAIAPRGEALARAVRALAAGRTTMLGDVQARVVGDATAPIWHFRRAPPRRSA